MKKVIAFVMALLCVLALVGCDNAEGNEVMAEFVGIVTNINDDNTGYLVEVTDHGSSALKVGDRVIVYTDDGSNAEYAVDDCIKVEFNGVVEELIAVSMADKRVTSVFSIEKADTTE